MRKPETEPGSHLDEFADRVGVSFQPFGSHLSFYRTEIPQLPPTVPEGTPQPPQQPLQFDLVGHVRMTAEHLKVSIFLAWNHIIQVEAASKLHVDLPQESLDGMGIQRAQWDTFWSGVAQPNDSQEQSVVNVAETQPQPVAIGDTTTYLPVPNQPEPAAVAPPA